MASSAQAVEHYEIARYGTLKTWAKELGHNDAGEAVRWSFTAIKPDSFRWLGERSRDDGKSWHLQAEFLARRIP